jgi:rod shape-determining protein MreC
MKNSQSRQYYDNLGHISRAKNSIIPLLVLPFLFLYRKSKYIVLLSSAIFILLHFNYHSQVREVIQKHSDNFLSIVFDYKNSPLDVIDNIKKRIYTYWLAATYNDFLLKENAELRSKARLVKLLQDENAFLKQQLRFADQTVNNFITARMLLSSKSATDHNFMLNLGENHGIKTGMAVMNADGLLGRIIAVSPNSARVLAITDLRSKIPAVLAKSRVNCIVAGDSSFNKLRILYLPENFIPQDDDYIITAAQEEHTPYGIKIADVKVIDGKITAIPASNWLRGDFVQIVQ